MKQNLTWIVPIVDESGSMGSIKSDTIGAFNNFINEQKKVEGEAHVTLVKFNTKIEKVYELSIQHAGMLDETNYRPNNWTRLYDAIAFTIKDIKSQIKGISKEERPEKVLFVIITDGIENRSTEFNKSQVFEMIKKREDKGWNFLYLGANQNAMKEGEKIGIDKINTVTWSADARGINTAYMAANTFATKFRNAKSSTEIASLDLNQEYQDADKMIKS